MLRRGCRNGRIARLPRLHDSAPGIHVPHPGVVELPHLLRLLGMLVDSIRRLTRIRSQVKERLDSLLRLFRSDPLRHIARPLPGEVRRGMRQVQKERLLPIRLDEGHRISGDQVRRVALALDFVITQPEVRRSITSQVPIPRSSARMKTKFVGTAASPTDADTATIPIQPSIREKKPLIGQA